VMRMYCRLPCKSSVKEKARGSWARSGERAFGLIGSSGCARVPLGWWSLLATGPDIHLLPQAPRSCRRRSSLCSLPVPKQSERGLGSCLRRPAGQLQDLAACASNNPVFVLPYQEGFLRYRPACHFFGRHEVLFSALHGEHVGHHFPGHREGGPILVSSLDLPLPDQG